MRFHLSNAPKRHLPFVIVGAVAVCTAWVILAANVNAQIAYVVMCLVSVHVVNAFPRLQGAAEMLCHVPPMFKDVFARWRAHCQEHRHIRCVDDAPREFHVAVVHYIPAVRHPCQPHRVTCPDSGCLAFTAKPGETLGSGEILAKRVERKPLFRFAIWTRLADAWRLGTVLFHHFHLPADGRMFWKSGHIVRSCHFSYPTTIKGRLYHVC
jgi:hypothetical protein